MAGEIVDILETFGCDMQHSGIGPFIEMYNAIIHHRTRGIRRPVAGGILRDMAAQKGVYYLALDARMKAAIRPLLEAEDEALDYFNIHLQKRTVCAAADALAARTLAQLRGEC